MCGEHRLNASPSRRTAGSSPRVRGTHGNILADVFAFGIIPACAGNTGWSGRWSGFAGDHPRVCGEHAIIHGVRCAPMGSSPRVRGTPKMTYLKPREPGIIPACAGNTYVSLFMPTMARDHPRVCGEHRILFKMSTLDAGSSPRVRGTLRGRRAWRPRAGIIPACAGNTAWPPT